MRSGCNLEAATRSCISRSRGRIAGVFACVHNNNNNNNNFSDLTTGRCFHFTPASHLHLKPLGGLLQQLLPQRGVRSRRWDKASGPEQQKQLVVRYKRLSCAASLVAAWRRTDRGTLTRSTRRCYLASASSQPTSRPPPQPSRTSLGLNRPCCSAGAGELPNYTPDVRAVSHINDYL